MQLASDPSRAFAAYFAQSFGGDSTVDYRLVGLHEGGYAARARDGSPALLVPLEVLPGGAVGRRTAGCELLGHTSVRVSHDDRAWDCAAAALVCHDPDLVDAFAVLAGDVLRKTTGDRTWSSIRAVVDDWLTLLAPKGRPTPEHEIGLWGELWFIQQAHDVPRVLAGWRGPDGDNVDFFLGGVSVEVKTSRQHHHHFVSQTQIATPAGDLPAWLLSLWVKADPHGANRRSVPMLVDAILGAVPDRADALHRIARAGYSPADRATYTMTLVVLEEPSWFAASSVPRVRAADRGVSNLRYQVSLDSDRQANEEARRMLWVHFHDHGYEPKP